MVTADRQGAARLGRFVSGGYHSVPGMVSVQTQVSRGLRDRRGDRGCLAWLAYPLL